MISKTNTSTSLILLGLTAPFSNSFSSASVDKHWTFDQIYAVEVTYSDNNESKSRIEDYVNSVYRSEKGLVDNYSQIDGAFFHSVQVFADSQVDLEKEFYLAMDDLLFSKINNSPSKKRF
jgi:hypothetical protein